MRRLTLILSIAGCIAAFGLVGCGSSSSSSASSAAGSAATSSAAGASSTAAGTTHFAKTKFLLHAGLAFGAFHRYVYKPFKSGDLKHPFAHKLTLVKAGLSALFIEHELRLAAADVKSSKILSTLFSPITAVADKISSLKGSITSGKVASSEIDGLQSQLGSIGSTASGKGQAIQSLIPSASQLATGGA